ncbi:hypothetical protein [Novosphingobium sp.]|uniref:hypothetical protein n=1 Tax=Novosphingobium sp. TaxID=1874826 RepID=UPI0025E5C15C|nr:hypothetical protein [Novosphingobium sp.]MCC6925086.1 hypothetical protein [Novosphingobium sp.]
MRWVAAIASAALLAGPAHAENVALIGSGVWRGTIGKLPVVACFQEGSWTTGSYYYLSSKRPIRLTRDDNGQWNEQPGGDGKVTGTWQIGRNGAQLVGEWSDGGKRLPISLDQLPDGKDENQGCASEAFMAPRDGPVTVTRRPANRTAAPHTIISYRPPDWFSGVEIASFALPVERPGDRKINARFELAPTAPAVIGYRECFQGSLMMGGTDGEYTQIYEAAEIGPMFVRALDRSSGYCGGAHPYWGYSWMNFDRQTGLPIVIDRWFARQAVRKQNYPSTDGASLNPGPALLRAIMRRYRQDQKEDGDECRTSLAEQATWSVGVSAKGLIFTPELPHVMQACSDDLLVPYSELAPHLSVEGKAAIARLGLGKARR